VSDQCKKEVWGGSTWRPTRVPCSRKAVKDGYCKQHNPEAASKRSAEKVAGWVREATVKRVGEAVLNLTPEEQATLPPSIRALLEAP